MAHARKCEGSVHLSVHPSTEEVLPRDGPRLATSWITANFVIESKMSARPRRIFPRYFVGGSGFLSGSLVELMSSSDRPFVYERDDAPRKWLRTEKGLRRTKLSPADPNRAVRRLSINFPIEFKSQLITLYSLQPDFRRTRECDFIFSLELYSTCKQMSFSNE